MAAQYYIGASFYGDELQHYGILGQKWGVRRYQYEDGSLTPEGKERYGQLGEYTNTKSVARRLLTGDHILGLERSRAKREERLKQLVEEDEANGRNSALSKTAYEAQKQKNIDIDRYNSHTSTGKLFLQNVLLTGYGADAYRSARARGASRGRSFVESVLDTNIAYMTFGLVGQSGLKDEAERRKYGAPGA